MADIKLVTPTERSKGTRPSRRLRKEGIIPGVVYGLQEDPVSIEINYRDLRSALGTEAGTNAILHLDINGARHLSIVKELQRHPTKDEVLHVDFLRVNPDEEVQIEVPVNLVGHAKKVEQEKGIIDQIVFTLSVMAKPDNIPNSLEYDITEMVVGDTLTVGDLDMPEGSYAVLEEDSPVAAAVLTRMALVEEVPEAEGEEGEEGEEAAEGEEGKEPAEGSGEKSSGDSDSKEES